MAKESERKPGPGRPPRAATASLERFELRLTANEKGRWLRAADAESIPLADWIRAACEDRIKRAERAKESEVA